MKLYKSRTLVIEIETMVIAHGAEFLGQIVVDVFQNIHQSSADVYVQFVEIVYSKITEKDNNDRDIQYMYIYVQRYR